MNFRMNDYIHPRQAGMPAPPLRTGMSKILSLIPELIVLGNPLRTVRRWLCFLDQLRFKNLHGMQYVE